MNEIIKTVPLFVLSIIIFLISNSFLKKIKKENNAAIHGFGKLTITRVKGAKTFSLILFLMLLLKTIYTFFFNF